MVVCDEPLYSHGLQTWDIMRVYCDLFGDREQETEVFDRATSIHAIKASDDFTEFALFGDTSFVGLDIDTTIQRLL